ncbi:MAG: DUF4382 domain-containing protein [Chitinophagaceae bacterium]|nr:DUF4382 domain-containing protein [Chitinophagaceae bacterium]
MKQFVSIVAVVFVFCTFSACNNKESGSEQLGNARLEIRLTDDPADYDAIYIDIQDVQFNVSGNNADNWQSLVGVNKGIYNLLDLVNDKDTLLVNADIPSGKLHQIRLVLGPANSIVVDGVSMPLETPSAQQSGLKLNVQQDVLAGVLYTLVLDFDAARSVVHTGSNKYILKPVIRTVLAAVGGSIGGYVFPNNVLTAVYAIQGLDTIATTFTAPSGAFLVKGITPGTYDVHFIPADPAFRKEYKAGVNVLAGKVSIVDTVRLIR